VTVVVSDRLPEVPVIVSFVLWDEAADEDGVNLKAVEPFVVTLVGLKAAVTPVGNPEIENVTGPVKPSTGARVIVSVTVTGGVQNPKKQNGGVTVTLVDAGVSVKRPAFAAATGTLRLTGVAAA